MIHRLLFQEHLGREGPAPAESYFRWCYDFGSDSQPSGQTTTIQSQRPIPVIEDALGNVIPRAQELLDIPVQQPGFDTVVPFSGQTENALQLQEARALAGSPLEQTAQDVILQTARGDFLNRDNPFFAEFADSIAGDIGATINSRFAQSNRLGSQANAEALSRGISNALVPIGFQNFAQERENQLNAAQLAPQLAGIDFQNISQLRDVGLSREQQQGAQLQDQINRFNFSQLEPRQRIAEVLALIQGGNIGGQTTTQQPIFSQSRGSQALGAGLGLASIGNTLFNRTTGLFPKTFGG